MLRKKYASSILSWSMAAKAKPLLLWGARQVGKTTLMKEFSSSYHPDHIYLNFEFDKQLHSLFADSLDPVHILSNLEIYLGRPISPEKTLLIFDEIQDCDNALNSLKYFAEAEESYRVIAAGSLLGVKHSKMGFPVGQVEFLDVYPLSFEEFLEMTGFEHLVAFIENLTTSATIPEAIHQKLLKKVREYIWLGGMPEVVAAYVKEPGNFERLRTIQQQIVRTYQLDFAKYAPPSQVAKIAEIYEQIPIQIAKENKKFKISGVAKQARLREYGEALQWLVDAGVVYKIKSVSHIEIPLGSHADRDVFKLFLLDTGLLGAQLNVPVKLILDQTELFSSFKGALAESYVANQLKAHNHKEIYYWSMGSSAEVDFVVQVGSHVFPLEVKSGVNIRSKSLTRFGEKYDIKNLARCTPLNLRSDGEITNYPMYCVSLFPGLGGTR